MNKYLIDQWAQFNADYPRRQVWLEVVKGVALVLLIGAVAVIMAMAE